MQTRESGSLTVVQTLQAVDITTGGGGGGRGWALGAGADLGGGLATRGGTTFGTGGGGCRAVLELWRWEEEYDGAGLLL